MSCDAAPDEPESPSSAPPPEVSEQPPTAAAHQRRQAAGPPAPDALASLPPTAPFTQPAIPDPAGANPATPDPPASVPPTAPHPQPTALPPHGSLLGIDFGVVRVGLAVCDPDRRIASPFDTYRRRSERLDAAYFARLVAERRIVGLVVGLPLHAWGEESDASQAARAFGGWLGGVTGLPVVFWDERLTTWMAERVLHKARLSYRKRRERRDRLAAHFILQSYLDAGCPPAEAGIRRPPRPCPDSG